MTYSYMVILINSGRKTREELLVMCDVFFMNERIDGPQYNDLVAKINEKYPV